MRAINKVLYDEYSKKFFGNVNGSMIPISGTGNSSGATSVPSLPATGESGKIYYNTTDNNYYVWDSASNAYVNMVSPDIKVITSLSDVPRIPDGGQTAINSYVLQPNVFYNIENWDRSLGSSTAIEFSFNSTEGIFAGRFTAWADDMNITWPASVTTPDSVDTTIVNGHTYEFNVWQGVLLLTDVTSSESTNVTNDTAV
jgi:hypothetical protein